MKKIYQQIKCGYCRRKKIVTVDQIEKRKGLVFCSQKCKSIFNWLIKNYKKVSWQSDFKKKFQRYPLPKDEMIVKQEKKIVLKSVEMFIFEKQIDYFFKYGELPNEI